MLQERRRGIQETNEVGRVFYDMTGEKNIKTAMLFRRNGVAELAVGPDEIDLLDHAHIDARMRLVFCDKAVVCQVVKRGAVPTSRSWGNRVETRANLDDTAMLWHRCKQGLRAGRHVCTPHRGYLDQLDGASAMQPYDTKE